MMDQQDLSENIYSQDLLLPNYLCLIYKPNCNNSGLYDSQYSSFRRKPESSIASDLDPGFHRDDERKTPE